MQLQQITNLTSSQTITMSSREIADLTGKEHKHVMRDIRTLIETLEQSPDLDFACKTSTYAGVTGQLYQQYELDKDTCMTLLLGYDAVARMRVVKRWQELEAKQQQNLLVLPNFTDPAEAAIAWATEYKAKQLALKQLEVAKPKVEFVDTFVDRGSNRNITSVAKELGITAIALGKWLRAKGYMNKSTKKQEWNKEFIDKGYGVQKLFNTEVKEDTFKSGSQVLVTPAGDLFIKEQVKKHGLVVYFDKQE